MSDRDPTLVSAAPDRPIAALADRGYGLRRIVEADLGEDLLPRQALVDEIASQLFDTEQPLRFALLHGLVPLLESVSLMTRDEAALAARRFFRAVIDGVSPRLLDGHSDLVNPLEVPFQTIEYGFDGFNANQGYQPYAEMQVRDGFISTKCIHFDAAEPISTNIYGPCINIAGGWPVVADAAMYCRDHGLRIVDVLERLEGYPVSFRAPHYQTLVEDYSLCFELDMERDTPCLIALNDVFAGGIAHGATAAIAKVPDEQASRPLWHIAFDYERLGDIDRWYAMLGLDGPPSRAPGERDEKNLIDERNRRCARGPLRVGVTGS